MTQGAFHLLPREAFPVTLRARRADTHEVVWEEILQTPETLTSVYIPPLAKIHNVAIEVEAEYADGTIERS